MCKDEISRLSTSETEIQNPTQPQTDPQLIPTNGMHASHNYETTHRCHQRDVIHKTSYTKDCTERLQPTSVLRTNHKIYKNHKKNNVED